MTVCDDPGRCPSYALVMWDNERGPEGAGHTPGPLTHPSVAAGEEG
jgi:hypothetical protein